MVDKKLVEKLDKIAAAVDQIVLQLNEVYAELPEHNGWFEDIPVAAANLYDDIANAASIFDEEEK